jgi:hypothetical protein
VHVEEEEAAPIEVNWDEIDKQYEQMPGGKGYPLAPAATSPMSRDESTVIGSVGHSSTFTYPPNAIDEVHRLQKPDGRNFYQ